MKLAESKPKANIPSPAKTPPARSAPVLALHDETRWGFSCLTLSVIAGGPRLQHGPRPLAYPIFRRNHPSELEKAVLLTTAIEADFAACTIRVVSASPASLRWAWRSTGQASQSLIWNDLHLNWHLCKAWPLLPPSLLRWWRCSRRSLSGLARGPCCIAGPQPPPA